MFTATVKRALAHQKGCCGEALLSFSQDCKFSAKNVANVAMEVTAIKRASNSIKMDHLSHVFTGPLGCHFRRCSRCPIEMAPPVSCAFAGKKLASERQWLPRFSAHVRSLLGRARHTGRARCTGGLYCSASAPLCFYIAACSCQCLLCSFFLMCPVSISCLGLQ